MACWYPSSSQEAWFPQLRVNRLRKEAAAKIIKDESVTPKPRRKTKAVTEENVS